MGGCLRREQEGGQILLFTGIFKYELHIKDCNDLALSLRDVNVAVHAGDAADASLDIAAFSLELEQFLLEPFARPLAAVFVDPVPVVGVVKDHGFFLSFFFFLFAHAEPGRTEVLYIY